MQYLPGRSFRLILGFLVFVLVLALPAAASDKADYWLDTLWERYQQGGVVARYGYELVNKQGNMVPGQRGDVRMLIVDGSHQRHHASIMFFSEDTELPPEAEPVVVEQVLDGESYWRSVDFPGEAPTVVRLPLSRVLETPNTLPLVDPVFGGNLNLFEIIEGLRKKARFKKARELDGLTVLEGRIRGRRGGMPTTKVRLSFAAEGLVRELSMVTPGRFEYRLELRTMSTPRQDLPPETFEYRPPSGAKVYEKSAGDSDGRD